MDTGKFKKWAGRFGSSYVKRKIERGDQKFLQKLSRAVLNSQLKSLTPTQLNEAFQKREDLTKHFHGNLWRLHRLQNDFDVQNETIKLVVQRHKETFDINWIYEWWKKDRLDLYELLINHTQREQFERWLVTQINNLANKLINSL